MHVYTCRSIFWVVFSCSTPQFLLLYWFTFPTHYILNCTVAPCCVVVFRRSTGIGPNYPANYTQWHPVTPNVSPLKQVSSSMIKTCTTVHKWTSVIPKCFFHCWLCSKFSMLCFMYFASTLALISALPWHPLHFWSVQVLCIVTAHGGGRCMTIHTVQGSSSRKTTLVDQMWNVM